MNHPKKCCVLILVVAAGALCFRLPLLTQRPMHTDEAVHAEKFRLLLEEDFYQYDPHEYHGPTLNYFTLISAHLAGAKKLSEINEFTLRIIPVIFGTLLVLLILTACDDFGFPTALIAAILTCISPAMLFYSRYYIQEMLLVCFTFGVIVGGYRFIQKKNFFWAVITGVFLGLTHATKETSVIAFLSIIFALGLTAIFHHVQGESTSKIFKKIKLLNFVSMFLVAIFVSALFYSSFFTNIGGIWDSVRAYGDYFSRAGGNRLHIHPWYYYLKILLFSKYNNGQIWSEAFIVVLAVIGFVAAIIKKPSNVFNVVFIRFVAFYTLIMTVIYSAIPYKTPWCMLSFLHGMILLAGFAVYIIIKSSQSLPVRLFIFVLLYAGGIHLVWQGWLASYKYYADPQNPYVYAHTSKDVLKIEPLIEQIANVSPWGHNIFIQVIFPEADYWPLPWYLRRFDNVGYYIEVDKDSPIAPVIIASPAVEAELINKLYEMRPPGERDLYVPLFDDYMELRPHVELRGYIKKKLCDNLAQR